MKGNSANMKSVYLDNSSTSFPKAPSLGKVMGEHIDNAGYNISRGGYENAYEVEGEIFEIRCLLADFFGAKDPGNVIFTSGATGSLNTIINGFLKTGNSVVTTSMEHNAVVRPLWNLQKKGVVWKESVCDIDGNLDINDFKNNVDENTDIVIAIHASNVNGTITPIEEMGKHCYEKNVPFVVDASQTAGSEDIDIEKIKASAIVLPGHKSMLGPQGIGCIIFGNSSFAENLEMTLLGGTGSVSHSEEMPTEMPDKFEPGTPNIPGIIGLGYSTRYILKEGRANIKEKKSYLTKLFIDEILNMKNIRLVGKSTMENRCSVVSLDFYDKDNAEIAYRLETEYGILTRCGMHCSPHAHKTFGTYPSGTIRFSIGCFNSEEDIKLAVEAINKAIM